MKKIIIMTFFAVVITGCSNKDEMKLNEIIASTQAAVQPIATEANLAYWNGTISGDSAEFEKYAKANMKLIEIYSNKVVFSALKSIKERGKIKDSILNRQLTILYNQFLGNQTDTALLNTIIKKTSLLEQKYAAFRANYKGKPISDNEVEDILSKSQNSTELEQVWKSHKAIGEIVSADVIELIKLRNIVAKSLGFENYHTMSLELSGQNPNDISSLFDELDSLTRGAFINVKKELDSSFAVRHNITEDQLMPWHYQDRFFQEAPQLYPVDLDKYYKGKSLEEITQKFYASIGLDVSNIMSASDLYEKPLKNQHAYCIDINGNSDIRVLCNIKDNEKWMGTMLHEFGHGVYSLGHDIPQNPYFLRNAAHTFTTEAVAMIFGRLSRNPEWLKQNVGISNEEKERIEDACYKSSRLQQLVFSRWTQVVYRFEKSMYENPDQDLNSLWWTMVEKYQLLKKPEGRNAPDWASKIHLALYPCYYHNYQLGELFASQMHYFIVNNITKSGDIKNESYTGQTQVGKWMNETVLSTGMKYEWNDMIEKATGEKLTAKYFAKQFVD